MVAYATTMLQLVQSEPLLALVLYGPRAFLGLFFLVCLLLNLLSLCYVDLISPFTIRRCWLCPGK